MIRILYILRIPLSLLSTTIYHSIQYFKSTRSYRIRRDNPLDMNCKKSNFFFCDRLFQLSGHIVTHSLRRLSGPWVILKNEIIKVCIRPFPLTFSESYNTYGSSDVYTQVSRSPASDRIPVQSWQSLHLQSWSHPESGILPHQKGLHGYVA